VSRVRRLALAAVLVGGTLGPTAASLAAPVTHPPIAAPSRRHGATIALVVTPTLVRARLAGRHSVWLARAQTSWSHKAQSLLVLGSAWRAGRLWLHVLLPIRPDGSTGWIPRNNTQLSTTHYWVAVDKTRRVVKVYGHGRLVHSFSAVVGKPATPTPDGLAAVYEVDRQPDPEGFLGTWALPLTILSNTLHNFGGGPGRIAIHGRGGASLKDPLGSARSHGCIRLENTSVGWLAQMVRPGTPVQISG
jgi:lipoprotein-anchoring transpeptidase ErfK/SrfK